MNRLRLALIAWACCVASTTLHAADTIAFADVTVVDVVRGVLVPDQTVVVYGGRIDRMGPADDVPLDREVLVIDAEGAFLIPGLWDMHVHHIEDHATLPLYLVHGVTGVRAMGGDPEACVDTREAITRRELLGPRIATAGAFLDGRWPGEERWVVKTADEALRAIERLDALGVDFVKVHETVPREAYDAVLELAPEFGLDVAGHVPQAVTYAEAVAAGQASLEHANQMAERNLGEGATDSQAALEAAVQAFAEGEGAALFAAMVEQGTAFTPTLVAHAGILHGADPESGVWDDPRLAWAPPALVNEWRTTLPVDQLPADFVPQRRLVDRAARGLVAAAQRAGVTLLAGSDVGAPHVYPGSSLADELQALVDAGLSPAEALRAATRAPAVFLDLEDQLGEIVPGRIADLVLLDADPLQDIGAVRSVRAVMTRGQLLDRATLDALRDEAAAVVEAAIEVEADSAER